MQAKSACARCPHTHTAGCSRINNDEPSHSPSPNLPRGHKRNVRMREPGMRYRPDQYDQTACDGLKTATHGRCPPTCEGLGLAGNVCPVVLSCSDPNGCSMTPLVGFGFNPTIVRAPEHLRRSGVEFIGTDRFEQNNKSVRAGRGEASTQFQSSAPRRIEWSVEPRASRKGWVLGSYRSSVQC